MKIENKDEVFYMVMFTEYGNHWKIEIINFLRNVVNDNYILKVLNYKSDIKDH